MSRIEVTHTDHISPGELGEMIHKLEMGFGVTTHSIIVSLKKYREILLESYTTHLNQEEPEFWLGRKKTPFQRGPFIRSTDQ